MSTTITEALAEIKTINSRLTKKRTFVREFLYRQDSVRDPLDKEGGSRDAIRREMQSIYDLEQRIVDIRRAISKANAETEITVSGVSRSISDWLTWRREVVTGRTTFLNSISKALSHMRAEAMRKGVAVTSGDPQTRDDVIVNVDEKALADEIEEIEEILGTLDGMLSLLNATTLIEI